MDADWVPRHVDVLGVSKSSARRLGGCAGFRPRLSLDRCVFWRAAWPGQSLHVCWQACCHPSPKMQQPSFASEFMCGSWPAMFGPPPAVLRASPHVESSMASSWAVLLLGGSLAGSLRSALHHRRRLQCALPQLLYSRDGWSHPHKPQLPGRPGLGYPCVSDLHSGRLKVIAHLLCIDGLPGMAGTQPRPTGCSQLALHSKSCHSRCAASTEDSEASNPAHQELPIQSHQLCLEPTVSQALRACTKSKIHVAIYTSLYH